MNVTSKSKKNVAQKSSPEMAGMAVYRNLLHSMQRCSIRQPIATLSVGNIPAFSTQLQTKLDKQYPPGIDQNKHYMSTCSGFRTGFPSMKQPPAVFNSNQLTLSIPTASTLAHSARQFSTSAPNCKKIRNKRWYAKWRNKYFDWKTYKGEARGMLPEREFDKVLNYKAFDKDTRRNQVVTEFEKLLEKERIVTKYGLARAVTRFTHLVIDVAKENNEPLIYSWLNKKELVPVIFDDLLARYDGPPGGEYARVYRVRDTVYPLKSYKGQRAVVELIGNNLPPIVAPESDIESSTVAQWKKINEKRLNGDPTLV